MVGLPYPQSTQPLDGRRPWNGDGSLGVEKYHPAEPEHGHIFLYLPNFPPPGGGMCWGHSECPRLRPRLDDP